MKCWYAAAGLGQIGSERASCTGESRMAKSRNCITKAETVPRKVENAFRKAETASQSGNSTTKSRKCFAESGNYIAECQSRFEVNQKCFTDSQRCFALPAEAAFAVLGSFRPGRRCILSLVSYRLSRVSRLGFTILGALISLSLLSL